MKLQTKDYLEICPGCLACYNQGRLTFYWFRLNKETTLKQIEAALDIEEIHKRAKTPYAEDVMTFDSDKELNEYLEETFTETYSINDDNPLINYIDWDKVVRDLKMDYEEVDISGTTYAWRSL
jgi:hypothetical protein